MKYVIFILIITGTIKDCTNKAQPNFSKLKIIEINNIKLTNQEVYFQFEEKTGLFSGFSGCNQFSGNYEIQDDKVSVSNLFYSKKFCANLEVKEQSFFNLLQTIHHYQINKEIITFFDEDNRLIFIAKIEK